MGGEGRKVGQSGGVGRGMWWGMPGELRGKEQCQPHIPLPCVCPDLEDSCSSSGV